MHGKRSKLAQKIIHHLCTILTCVVRAGMMQNSFTCRKNVNYVLGCSHWRSESAFYLFHVFPDRLQPDTMAGNVRCVAKQRVVLVWMLVVVTYEAQCPNVYILVFATWKTAETFFTLIDWIFGIKQKKMKDILLYHFMWYVATMLMSLGLLYRFNLWYHDKNRQKIPAF